MIKHVVFTNEQQAKIFCYDLAATLTQRQRASGTHFYSAVMPHPDQAVAKWAVAVDDSDQDAVAVTTSSGYSLVDLDSTWYPVPQSQI